MSHKGSYLAVIATGSYLWIPLRPPRATGSGARAGQFAAGFALFRIRGDPGSPLPKPVFDSRGDWI